MFGQAANSTPPMLPIRPQMVIDSPLLLRQDVIDAINGVSKQKNTKDLRITYYGPTGNPMANGKMPYEGAVATSWTRDKNGKIIDDIPMGTKIKIDGKEYTVGDRTAQWVHDKHGNTIDIFSNKPNNELLKLGVSKKTVEY